MCEEPAGGARLKRLSDNDLAARRNRQNGIDQQILRSVAASVEQIGNDQIHEPLGLRASDRGQDDQAGMEFHSRGEFPEIARIFRHDDSVFPNRSGEDVAIRIPQPAPIAWMNRIVQAAFVEMAAERRRDALVDEKSHTVFAARREAGRPTRG
jgi:hypothetical protein